MNDFAQFVGFFTAHMVWMLECGENVVPLIAVQNVGKRWFQRYDDTSYEHAVATAREQLQSILSSSCGDYALLAYDGFFTHDGKRNESLFIWADEIGNLAGMSFLLVIPYRSARSKEGLAIYRPIVTKANSLDMNTFLDHFYEGVLSHTEGIKFWLAHIDANYEELDEKQLSAAIIKGDIKQIRRLIKIEYHLNFGLTDQDAYRNFCTAIIEGNIEQIKTLIRHGLIVNSADQDGNAPVHAAAIFSDKKEIMELLFERGANINAVNKEQNTPLHYAADRGKTEIVKFLLEKGVNIDAVDNQLGWTPLRRAVHHGNKEMAELLLQRGANICIVDKNGFTLLHSAASEGHEEMVKFLLTKGINIDAVDHQDEWTSLHYAVYINNKVIVELLLKEGANTNILDKEGLTPLHYAISYGYKEVIELLSAESKH